MYTLKPIFINFFLVIRSLVVRSFFASQESYFTSGRDSGNFVVGACTLATTGTDPKAVKAARSWTRHREAVDRKAAGAANLVALEAFHSLAYHLLGASVGVVRQIWQHHCAAYLLTSCNHQLTAATWSINHSIKCRIGLTAQTCLKVASIRWVHHWFSRRIVAWRDPRCSSGSRHREQLHYQR